MMCLHFMLGVALACQGRGDIWHRSEGDDFFYPRDFLYLLIQKRILYLYKFYMPIYNQ